MPRRAKIALSAVVLIAGLVFAWRFRKPHGAKPASMPIADSSSVSTVAQATPTSFNAEPAAAAQSRPSAPPLDLAATPIGQATSSASPPHNTAATTPPFEPAASTTQLSASPATANVVEDNPWHTAAGASTPAGSQPMMPTAPPDFGGAPRPNSGDSSIFQGDPLPAGSPLQTHKIVDGDSLPLLAERYLGSAARANEIFACNRDVLSDPEVLPIGVRLRIPSGVVQSPPAAGRQPPPVSDRPVAINTTQQSVASAAAVESTLPAAAAPANPPSTSTASTGTASTAPLLSLGSSGLSPLPPIAASERSAGKIYIVQSGDTLSGIAQKLYGDGARADQLLQANREQLSAAQDLHPGMILEAP